MKRINTIAATLRTFSLVMIMLLPLALPAAAVASSPDNNSGASAARRQTRGTRQRTKKPRRTSGAATQAAATPTPTSEDATAGNGARVGKLIVEEIKEARLAQLLEPLPTQPRPLLVNFWATWCEPCRKEFPDLVRVDKEFHPRGLEFITVSLDDISEIASGVPQFLREMRATRMPAFLLNADDPETAIIGVDRSWRGELPATFLYDRNGKLVFSHKGRINAEELRTRLKAVMNDK